MTTNKTTIAAALLAALTAGWAGFASAGQGPGIGPEGEWLAPSRINAEGDWETPSSIGPDGEWRTPEIGSVRERPAPAASAPSRLRGDVCASRRAPAYRCSVERETDIGPIVLCGDPVKNDYHAVWAGGVPMSLRPGATSPVYLYLYDARSGAKTFALEIVNYPASRDSFAMNVYGADHIVLKSRRLARYSCARIQP